MRLHVIAVGDRLPHWVDEGVSEYCKRVKGRLSLKVVTVSAAKRTKNANLESVIEEEGRRLMTRIPDHADVIALERTGQHWSTETLADKLADWMQQGRDRVFLIGGPEGLSKQCLNRAEVQLSLSAMTLAHPIARLMLTEQLYRAYAINEGLPYHRGPSK